MPPGGRAGERPIIMYTIVQQKAQSHVYCMHRAKCMVEKVLMNLINDQRFKKNSLLLFSLNISLMKPTINLSEFMSFVYTLFFELYLIGEILVTMLN